MRESDEGLHPEAIARARRATIRLWSGLVIAAAGLAAVFALGETYLGFGVALVGTGLLPADKLLELLPFGKRP